MGDDDDAALSDMLRHLDVASPHDLQEGSPEVVQFLSEIAAVLNTLAVSDFGGRIGAVRQEGLVEHVIGAALQRFGDVDPHPGAFGKAAMLLRGITAGHPFQDGNKRTGFLLATFYLEQVGHSLPEHLSVESAEALSLAISAGTLRDVEEITRQLEALWQPEEGCHEH